MVLSERENMNQDNASCCFSAGSFNVLPVSDFEALLANAE